MPSRKGELDMHSSARALIVCAATATSLWTVPAASFAQEMPSPSGALTVDQTRAAFASTGYQVGDAHTWDWTQPSFTSFRVSDPATQRILTVVVYPSTAGADTARLEAARGVAQNSSTSD